MKSLIFGLAILFGASMVCAQEICDEDVEILDETAIETPDMAPVTAPTTTPGMTTDTAKDTAKEMRKDLIETAIANGNFKTLAKALTAADLVHTLKGQGPFTIFAPTDEAFARLPAGTLDNLLKPENKSKLAAILTYHVVPGEFTVAEVMKLPKTKTLEGKEVNIKVKDGKVFINEAEVQTPDLKCKNGVIHVINAVLMPKE